ncbi:MAG: hypothetical protein ACLFV7_05435 [Phycisphaerae bacterium]
MYLYTFRVIALGTVCVLVSMLLTIRRENARSSHLAALAARPVIVWHRDPNGRVWVQFADDPPRVYEPNAASVTAAPVDGGSTAAEAPPATSTPAFPGERP